MVAGDSAAKRSPTVVWAGGGRISVLVLVSIPPPPPPHTVTDVMGLVAGERTLLLRGNSAAVASGQQVRYCKSRRDCRMLDSKLSLAEA